MRSHTAVSIVLPFSAEETWSVVRDFGDYRWGEGVGLATIEGDDANKPGTIRRFAYYGQPSEQRLVTYDSEQRTMTWESVAPFDVTLSHYAATVRVLPVTITDHSFIEWSVEFDATVDAVAHWRDHQRREFRKSLERLAIYIGWFKRGEVD